MSPECTGTDGWCGEMASELDGRQRSIAMRMIVDADKLQWNAASALESPFAEAASEATGLPPNSGFSQWSETPTPFAEATDGLMSESEMDLLLAEVFGELRDETFDEALAYLAEETEQAVADRFTSETAASGSERERYAEAQLSALRFETEQYIDALEAGLTGMDVESLTDEQLDELLDRFDPEAGELTPAGEEFISGIVRKAKKVVKFVAKAAKGIGNVAGAAVL